MALQLKVAHTDAYPSFLTVFQTITYIATSTEAGYTHPPPLSQNIVLALALT